MPSLPNQEQKSGKDAGLPWSLHGREAEIVQLRENEKLTFEKIGAAIGSTGEGARLAYRRGKGMGL